MHGAVRDARFKRSLEAHTCIHAHTPGPRAQLRTRREARQRLQHWAVVDAEAKRASVMIDDESNERAIGLLLEVGRISGAIGENESLVAIWIALRRLMVS